MVPDVLRQRGIRAWFRRHRRLLLVGSVMLVCGGLVLLGAGLTQQFFPKTVVEAAATEPEGEVEGTVEATTVPDVLGLDESTARRVFTDSGIAQRISITERPAGGPAGLVVAQVPAAGTTPSDDPIELTVSTAVAVPDVAGLSSEDARDQLEQLGAVVTFTRVVSADAAEGTVLAVNPAVGETLDLLVDLSIADAGASITLGSVDAISNDGCQILSRGAVNGVALDDSVGCGASTEGASREWTLGRHATTIEATLGLLDTGERGIATVRFIGDDVELFKQEVAFGTSSQIRVDVRGVLRLRVEVTGSSSELVAVMANAIVRAPEADLALIGEEQ